MPEQQTEDAVKVNKWDGNAIKNALDDCVKKVSFALWWLLLYDSRRGIVEDNYGYSESHKLLDTRLAISTLSVSFAGLALLWDYLYPFPLSKNVLILCVCSYFVLMGVLQMFAWYVERGIFYTAIDYSDNKKWHFSSHMQKYETGYTLEAEVIDTKGNSNRTRSGNFEGCVTKWISENGTILEDLLKVEVLKLHESLASSKKTN